VTFSGNPDVGATFTVTGHLIPQLEVGLSALGGAASTSVFVNLDASADFGVATSTASDAQACASANTTLDVGIGAQGSFFNVFDASVRKSLFKANFPLLQVRMRVIHFLLTFVLNRRDNDRINASGVRTRMRALPPTQRPLARGAATRRAGGRLFLCGPGPSRWSVL
jgi:hypothetical protein